MDTDISNVKIINLITGIHEENMAIYHALLVRAGVTEKEAEEIVTGINKKWKERLYK